MTDPPTSSQFAFFIYLYTTVDFKRFRRSFLRLDSIVLTPIKIKNVRLNFKRPAALKFLRPNEQQKVEEKEEMCTFVVATGDEVSCKEREMKRI